jgi:hypothetical protein
MASEKEEAETSTVDVGVDRGNAAVDTGRFRKGIEEWGRVRFWPAWPGTTAGSGSEKLWARALKRAFDMALLLLVACKPTIIEFWNPNFVLNTSLRPWYRV